MLVATKCRMNLLYKLLIFSNKPAKKSQSRLRSYALSAMRHDSTAVREREPFPAIFVQGAQCEFSSGRARQHVILELIAQGDFLNLAGRGVRNFSNESDIVGHPPFGDFAFEKGQYFLFARL